MAIRPEDISGNVDALVKEIETRIDAAIKANPGALRGTLSSTSAAFNFEGIRAIVSSRLSSLYQIAGWENVKIVISGPRAGSGCDSVTRFDVNWSLTYPATRPSSGGRC